MKPLRSAAPAVMLVAIGILGGCRSEERGAQSHAARAPHPARTAPEPWHLRLFRLGRGGELVAHGYLIEFRGRKRFGFADGRGAWTRGVDKLTSSETGFSWDRLLEVERERDSRVVFRWNTPRRLSDPFIGTFEGRDEVASCRGRYEGTEASCTMLDERVAADVSRRKTWGVEVFAAFSGERVSAISFRYDSAVDGRVRVDDEESAVFSVDRPGPGRLAIGFGGGWLEAACVEEDVYRLYQVAGGPLETPISCRLRVVRSGREAIEEDAAGYLEFIGPSDAGTRAGADGGAQGASGAGERSRPAP